MRSAKIYWHCIIGAGLLSLNACSGCQQEVSSVQVDGRSLELATLPPTEDASQPEQTGPRVITIIGKPYTGSSQQDTHSGIATSQPSSPVGQPAVAAERPSQVPPGSTPEDALTKKLHDKLKEANIAFSDKNPPKIYVSGQSLDEFTNHYESKGQAVSRMSVPASVLVRPLLQERPELAGKIDLEALDKVIINQVVVEGTGVSAADKYIDPDTFQVVDKLFVTEMPPNLGRKE